MGVWAEKKTLLQYAEYMGTDEECLVWYALADAQWKAGRLSNNVKDKAFKHIRGTKKAIGLSGDVYAYRFEHECNNGFL